MDRVRLTETDTERLRLYGRCLRDREEGILYTDWTMSGFSVRFRGRTLMASVCAFPDNHMEMIPGFMPGQTTTISFPDWPLVGVELDGSGELYKKIQLTGREDVICLFESDQEEEHTIRVAKLTENFRTQLGWQALYGDGNLVQLPEEPAAKRIELIGDSITCGYGNDTREVNRVFFTADENGWLTHGAAAARELGFEPSFISISGITAHRQMDWAVYALDEIYEYTDRPLQDRKVKGDPVLLPGRPPFPNPDAEVSYEKWDFAAAPADYVVVNLGTNDSTGVMMAPDGKKAEEEFEEAYCSFIQMIRRLNGPQTRIICALGCMDYFLFDNIRRVVDRLRGETGDERLYCLKYQKMLPVGADAGAALHPSVGRHRKMGRELARFIRDIEETI